MDEMKKTCGKCKEEKEVGDYNKDRSRKDGLFPRCRACVRDDKKKYYTANRDVILEKMKVYSASRKDAKREYDKQYYRKNRERITKRTTQYKTDQRRTNPEYNLVETLRLQLRQALDGVGKVSSTKKLLGCTPKQFRDHIESQFTDGMGWGQRGKWHLDHRLPVAAFDMSIPKHQKYCWHYTNFQPLWAEDNLRKSDKYDPEELEAYLNSDLPDYPA